MKKLNLIIAAVVIAFSSCSKKDSIVTPTTPPVPVNERMLLSYAGVYTTNVFTYNADKTLKSYTWVNGYGRAEYSYQPGKLMITHYGNNIKVGLFIYELSAGIAQKLTSTFYDANGGVTDVYVTTYTYNSKGQKSKDDYTKNGSTYGSNSYTYDANNDMTILEIKDANGITTWKSVYEYDLALRDKSYSFGQFNSNGTGLIFPKVSQHLKKKQTITQNNAVTVYDYSYTLDASGYVLTGIVKDQANVTADNWTNTWE